MTKKIFKRDKCKWFLFDTVDKLCWCSAEGNMVRTLVDGIEYMRNMPLPIALDCADGCEFYEEVK